MKVSGCFVLAATLCALATAAVADERSAYYQRRAEMDLTVFKALDIDHNGVITRDEIRGDVDFGPRFDDMDVNRDNVVTQPELDRYIRLHYGIDEPGAAKASAVARHPGDQATAGQSGSGGTKQ
jgi:hypothetical protein